MDNLDQFECYDHLLFEPLSQRGWETEEVSWRSSSTDWNKYDTVIIRSPWDYQDDADAFLEVLEQIEDSSAQLENSLELIKWNIEKTYLQDLEDEGIRIVPTLWHHHFEDAMLNDFFKELETDEAIIKPTVSANADDTFWVNKNDAQQYTANLGSIFDDRSFMVQPFMENITEEGEFSVFFFGDTYSHTILKIPGANDFRVQEEHGGRLKTVEPEEKLLKSTRKLLHHVDPQPLYTRADYVRTPDDGFALMELELIEPSLYFNMDPQSPQRFAKVFDDWMTNS